MKKNKNIRIACPKRYHKNKKGFTLIEILFIIIIISILVSVVLVSLINARNKAQNNSAFTSFKSIASPAYMCLMSEVGAKLTTDAGGIKPIEGDNICSTTAVPDSTWPEFIKTGWSYDNFRWCRVDYVGEVHPTACAYDDLVCGGNSTTGTFCFMMNKDDKYMWCTLEGCRKDF